MKLKIKFNSFYQLIRYLNLLILVIFISTLAYFSYFLYQNVYLSLQKIEKINSLKSGIVFTEDIQTNLYQKISENLNKKQQGKEINFENLKNPFKPY